MRAKVALPLLHNCGSKIAQLYRVNALEPYLAARAVGVVLRFTAIDRKGVSDDVAQRYSVAFARSDPLSCWPAEGNEVATHGFYDLCRVSTQ